MGLSSRGRTRAVLAALVLLAGAAAVDGWQLRRDDRWNDAIRERRLPDDLRDAPAPARFARAAALAGAGDVDGALKAYAALQGDADVGLAARYNAANLLVRQAIEVRAGEQPGQAMPLLELAKETYRDVLRADPSSWPARYNLERTQRLLPDPEPGDSEVQPSPREAERAATTLRGVAQGLP